ncbi:hypothetical protein SpAn4DRAFT_4365 [Sporomusa ovata]|uniref:Uncharacterized protein n=1 Tax=Sporomusa ovata TaxID=2378 RepID=A0A0U1L5N1_9FIRM|nr:hypothetical protein SpAn4DRAFT_4365 [Sporomusa ovata]
MIDNTTMKIYNLDVKFNSLSLAQHLSWVFFLSFAEFGVGGQCLG